MLPASIEKFLKSEGKAGSKTLSYLGKHQGIVEALQTEIGAEILKGATERHELLARKVLEGNADVTEIAERKALFNILLNWSTILINYYRALNLVLKHE